MIMAKKVAVDVGFGRVKALADTGREISFPAAVGEYRPLKFAAGEEEALAVGYRGRNWWVGEAALEQATTRQTVDRARTVGEEGMTLLAAALAQVTEKDHELVNLVIGLPVKFYENMKTRYAEMARDVHKIDILSPAGLPATSRRVVIVDQVKVLPQPIGTLYNELLNDKGQIVNKDLAAGKIGIIDIGFNTLDLARTNRLTFINPQSDSFSGLGMFKAYQELAAGLYRRLEIELSPEHLDPVVRTGKVKIAGRQHDVTGLIDEAFQAAAEDILSRVKSLWPDRERWQLDQVLITGGGGALLGKYLAPLLEVPARLVDNPVMANVRGYLKFAGKVWQ
jgi:plasmid segregation protein ParM